MLQSIVLGVLCSRMLRRIGASDRIADGHARTAVAKMALAALAMTMLTWLLLHLLPQTSPLSSSTLPRALTSDWSWQAIRLLLGAGLGGIVYIALSQLLKIAELSWLLHRARSAIRRRAR